MWYNGSTNMGVHTMEGNNSLQLFEDQPIRSAWDAEKGEWYFSVVEANTLTRFVSPRSIGVERRKTPEALKMLRVLHFCP